MITYPLYLRISRMTPSDKTADEISEVTGLSLEDIHECWEISREEFISKHKVSPLYAEYCDSYFVCPEAENEKSLWKRHIRQVLVTMKIVKADLASRKQLSDVITPDTDFYDLYEAGRLTFEMDYEGAEKLLKLLNYECPYEQMDRKSQNYIDFVDSVICPGIRQGEFNFILKERTPIPTVTVFIN